MKCNSLKYKGEIYTREELSKVLATEQSSSEGVFNKIIGKTATDTQLSDKTIKKVNTFLEKAGIDVHKFSKDEWKYYTNNDKSVGFADTLKGIIAMIDGDERFTIGEEAAHMIVEIIEQTNPKLYNEMFNKIGQYKIFDLVMQDPLYVNNPSYQTDGKKDIKKLKKEAMGKLIAEMLAKKEGNTNEVDSFTYPSEDIEKMNIAQQWLSKLLDWLKNIFKKPGFNPFEETTDYLLGNKLFTGTIADVQFANGSYFNNQNQNAVNATLKLVKALRESKANTFFNNIYKKGNEEVFFNKLSQDLGVPKQQVDILKQWLQTNKVNTLEEAELGIMAEMSYTVEVNTARSAGISDKITGEEVQIDGKWFRNVRGQWMNSSQGYENEIPATKEEINKIESLNKGNNTDYYSNLAVPGGTNYTENEISTPGITPSIKGHAQFATDNGIGWFRSDDKLNTDGSNYVTKDEDNLSYEELSDNKIEVFKEAIGSNFGKAISLGIYNSWEEFQNTQINKVNSFGNTKTRRILELQSDLFQKGRDKGDLIAMNMQKSTIDDMLARNKITQNEYDDYLGTIQRNENKNNFLQLLNKEGNWINFFIKTIVQDSAKKGYEKVLFPTGDTASKVEGHETIEDFKKQKEDRIKELERDKWEVYFKDIESEEAWTETYSTKEQAESAKNAADASIQIIVGKKDNSNEISQLKEELKRVESEGFAALKPIYDFYENRVKNTLNKIYGKDNIVRIKDEYGNEWNQVNIDQKRDLGEIYYRLVNPEDNLQEQSKIINSIQDINSKVIKENNIYKINDNVIKYSFASENNKDEFISEYSEKGKNDINNILNLYIDKDGSLRDQFLEKTNDSQLAASQKFYDTLDKNIKERLLTYPKGTKFLYNTILYNEAKSRVTTADFLAVKPSGEVDIFTWEFINEPKKDISKTQRESMQKYIGQTKNILREAYGVKEFGDTRAIPIVLNFKKISNKKILNKLKIGNATVTDDELEYLQPIPVRDEKTGNEQIDKYIQKLNSLYKTINEAPVIEGRRDIKYSELNAIFTTIRHLQLTNNFRPLFTQVENQIENTNELLQKHKLDFEGKSFEDFTNLELNEEAIKLNNLAEALEIYKDIDLYFEDFFKENLDKHKDDLKDIKQLAAEARSASKNVKLIFNKFTSKYISEKRNIRDLLEAEKSVNTVDRNFRTLSSAPTKAVQTYWLIAEEFRNKTELQTQDYVERLIQIEKDLKESYKSKRLKISDYKKLIEKQVSGKGVNQLIDKYSSEFYKELKNKIEAKDYKWIKANIDVVKFEKWINDYKANKIKQIDESTYLGDKEEQANAKTKAKLDLEYITNLNSNVPYTNLIGLRQFPTDKWLSKEYQELQKNESVLALYNYALEINTKAKESEYLTAQKYKNFLPFIRKIIAEKFVFGGSFNPIESLISSLSIDDESVGYGNFNPLTGEIEDTIPKYFTSDISQAKIDKDGNSYQDYSNVSDDIFKNLAIYTKQVVEYENKKNVEGLANALYFVEKNKQSLQINQYGNLIKDALQFPNESNEVNSKFLKNYIKNNLYGQKYITSESSDVLLGKVGEGIANKWNSIAETMNNRFGTTLPKVSDEIKTRNLSLVKVIDAGNRMFTMKTLGLNVASSIAQFMGGNFQAFVTEGKYYNKSEFFAAEWKFATHKFIGDKENVHLAMMKTFLPLGDESLQRMMNNMSLSNLTKHSASDLIMSIMRNADSVVQYANFLAMMDNAIVIDKKLVNARAYYASTKEYQNRYNLSEADSRKLEKDFDNKVKELKEQFGVAKKANVVDGKFKIGDATEESIHKYRSLVQQIGKRAAGNISPNDESQIRFTILGRSFMMFKNWVPNLIYQRAQPLSYIAGTDSYEWGKMRMAIRYFSWNLLPNIKKIYDTVYATKDGINGLQKLYEQKKKDYFEKNNKQLEMTEAEFYDLVRQNLRSQVKDTLLVLGLISMFLAAKYFAPEDDEDKTTKAAYGYYLRTMDNITQEMSFYYNPMSLQHILSGGIFPGLGVLSDITKIFTNLATEIFGYTIGDQDLVDSTHPVKYIMKTFPVTKEMLNYIAIFEPEAAQEMGIVINSKAGR